MAAAPTPGELLGHWLRRQLPPEGRDWLDDRLGAVGRGAEERVLVIAMGFVSRRLGKADLELTGADFQAARAARPGWDPTGWSVDQAARLALLLAGFDGDEAAFAARVDSLCRTADIGELVTLYRGLLLYPGSGLLLARAREGTRSGMRPVFEAVAHRNPYPRERFDEEAWNQMVVKAVFVGSALDPIQGLDERRNSDLAGMLVDFAHERRAAGRPVPPELWRCVGPFADEGMLADLERVLRTGDEAGRQAAALALADCPRAEARELLGREPELRQLMAEGRIGWSTLASAA